MSLWLENLFFVATDVLKEALARKMVLGIFVMISAVLVAILFGLNLDIVDGAVSGIKIFGDALTGTGSFETHEFLVKIYRYFTMALHPLAIWITLIATSGLSVTILLPGRVEFLLSLPISRSQILLGLFVSMLALSALTLLYFVPALMLIFWWKLGVLNLSFLWNIPAILFILSPIYALMLLVSILLRVTLVNMSVSIGFYIFTAIAYAQTELVKVASLGAIAEEEGVFQVLWIVVCKIIPHSWRITDYLTQTPEKVVSFSELSQPIISNSAFMLVFLFFAVFIFEGKDY